MSEKSDVLFGPNSWTFDMVKNYEKLIYNSFLLFITSIGEQNSFYFSRKLVSFWNKEENK